MNRVCIEPTAFKNIRSGHITLGWRAYDNYAQTYSDSMLSIPDDNLEFLRLVVEATDNRLGDMLDYCIRNKRGLCIGDTWYDYQEIKEIMEGS